MNVRWTLLPLFVAFAPPSTAQTPAVLGKDDAAFANELYANGYTMLAEKLCDTIERTGKVGGKEIAGVRALHLKLRMDMAAKENDPIKRKDLISGIVKEKEALVADFPGTKEADDTASTLPEAYSALGTAISMAISKEKDVNLIAQLQKDGQKFFDQAKAKLTARVEALREKKDDPAFEKQFITAAFSLPKTYFYESLLYPAGEFRKKGLLEKAIEGFQEFGLDNADNSLNYDGMVFIGLAQKDLGLKDDALKSFDDCIAVRERFEKDAKGVYQVDIDWANTIANAVLQKMNLQQELKDFAGSIATAKSFFDSVLFAIDTRLGLPILAAQGNAQVGLGDAKGAGATAERLIAADPSGPWGAAGRDIQNKILNGVGAGPVGFDAAALLKIAKNLATRGQLELALQRARQAIDLARRDKSMANTGVEAYLFMGAIYSQRKPAWSQEAAVAFDAGADTFPSSDMAAEAVYQSLLTYVTLSAEDDKPFYKRRVEDRLKTLSTKYVNHPRAAFAQLTEGQQLLAKKEFVAAAASFSKIQPGSASFLEAQFLTAKAYYNQAHKLLEDKKDDEAKQYVKQCEELFTKLFGDLDKAKDKTLDLNDQTRLENRGFEARVMLSDLFLARGVGRAKDVLSVLQGADERYANDAEKQSRLWSLRISALKDLGQVEEAVKLLEALSKKDPNSKAIGPAAGQVARALDLKAGELKQAGKQSEADAMLHRAAEFYASSAHALLKGDALRPTEVDAIAQRLFALGLDFNGVPDGQDSFIGWDTKKAKDKTLWELSAELYAASIKVSPSTAGQRTLGRIYGFLGKWPEAALVYENYFDRETPIDPVTKKLVPDVKGETLDAYIEFGAAEEEAAAAKQDRDRAARADEIFDALNRNMPLDSARWWRARYYLIKSKYDQGRYADANRLLSDAEAHTNPPLGEKAGLTKQLADLKALLKNK